MKIQMTEINGVKWTIIGDKGEASGPSSARPPPNELPVEWAVYKATDTQITYVLPPNEESWVMRSPEST